MWQFPKKLLLSSVKQIRGLKIIKINNLVCQVKNTTRYCGEIPSECFENENFMFARGSEMTYQIGLNLIYFGMSVQA